MSSSTAGATKPVRILQVVGGMGRGGLDGWLMEVLRHSDPGRFRIDFLIHHGAVNAYEEEVRALGAGVVYCSPPSLRSLRGREFRRVLAEHGPYDVVHSHLHHVSGFYLRAAHRAGVPGRIVHSHLDDSMLQGAAGWPRRAYQGLMDLWIRRYATAGLATSVQAADALFGAGWRADPRWRLLYCGIDVDPFRVEHDRAQVRGELGVAGDEILIGHVGRYVAQKNHELLLPVFAEVCRRAPRARLLLVGDGPLAAEVGATIDRLGIRDRVIEAGIRTDVPRLMSGMDLFLFPSRYEGLGLALVEAQASGLPCVLSDVVPPEADFMEALVHRLPLDAPPARWADAVLQAHLRTPAGRLREEAVRVLERSRLNVRVSVRELEEVYARVRE